jgi:hypothetical protein
VKCDLFEALSAWLRCLPCYLKRPRRFSNASVYDECFGSTKLRRTWICGLVGLPRTNAGMSCEELAAKARENYDYSSCR